MSDEIKSLGILAGQGDLPLMLVNHCLDQKIPVCAVQFDGCHYDKWPSIPVLKSKIEKVGAIFDFFHENKVQNVVMIGQLSRPKMLSLRPDFEGVKTLFRIAFHLLVRGDDALLRCLRSQLENADFSVRGIDYYLKNLTESKGVLTKNSANKDQLNAIRPVIDALRAHGHDDKGQAALFHNDGSVDFETRAGTQALIEDKGQKGSILIKMMKPQQDPDLDRPTVGLQTIKSLAAVRGAGMFIQADSVLMVDKEAMIEQANVHGLFIEVIDA